MSDDDLCNCTRTRLIEFLIQSAHELKLSPIVKYSALSIFADRFYPSVARLGENKGARHWLLLPLTESKLQLFVVISFWISSKIHDSPPISVKDLKKLTDKFIKEQHFTSRDFLDAEVILLQVHARLLEYLLLQSHLDVKYILVGTIIISLVANSLILFIFFKVLEFKIGTSRIAFVFLDELVKEFKAVACIGEYLSFESCMDVMDLLYEEEETSSFSPRTLAASVLVAAYAITVPIQRWEFPVIPWVKFVASCNEDDVMEMVRKILKHVFG